MLKTLDATCLAGIVTVSGQVAAPVTILSQGTKSSSGIAVLDGARASYVTSNATDIADLTAHVKLALDALATALPTIASATAVPGAIAAAATAVVTLTTVSASLVAMQVNLK